MVQKFARTGIAALVLASAAMAVSALPAQASQVRPGVAQGEEVVNTFYSNAQETTVVGTHAFGSCGNYTTGEITSYFTTHSYLCPAVKPAKAPSARPDQVKPGVGLGEEVVVTYWSSAAHTDAVGEHFYGSCGVYQTGQVTNYQTSSAYNCPS